MLHSPLRLPSLENNGYTITYFHNSPAQPTISPPFPSSPLPPLTLPAPPLQHSNVFQYSTPFDQCIPPVKPQLVAEPHLPVINQLDSYHHDKLNAEQSKAFRSTSIKMNSAFIGLNSVLFITEAALVGSSFGSLAPVIAPLMVLHAGLIAKSATDITRKKRARKMGL